MCRSIKKLYNADPPATIVEVRASALQYIRKISGFHQPSKVNEKDFNEAVDACARISHELLVSLASTAQLKRHKT